MSRRRGRSRKRGVSRTNRPRPPGPPSSPKPSRDEFLRRVAERARERVRALQPVPGSEDWLPDTDLWSTAWHDHLERRYACPELLARGREIVARGAVTHLEIRQGGVRARVRAGSEYGVALDIALLSAPRWNALRELCSRRGWLRWEIVGQPPEAFRKAASPAACSRPRPRSPSAASVSTGASRSASTRRRRSTAWESGWMRFRKRFSNCAARTLAPWRTPR